MTTKQHIGSKLTAGIALLAVAAAENVSAADSVSADSSGYSLEEVVVTANKRGNQTLQDVGSSIGVIGAAELGESLGRGPSPAHQLPRRHHEGRAHHGRRGLLA